MRLSKATLAVGLPAAVQLRMFLTEELGSDFPEPAINALVYAFLTLGGRAEPPTLEEVLAVADFICPGTSQQFWLVMQEKQSGVPRRFLSVKQFLDARCEVGNPEFRVPLTVLYEAYTDFCARRRMVALNRRWFGRALSALLGKTIRKVRPRPPGISDRNRPFWYKGIRLRTADMR